MTQDEPLIFSFNVGESLQERYFFPVKLLEEVGQLQRKKAFKLLLLSYIRPQEKRKKYVGIDIAVRKKGIEVYSLSLC